jgi:hypothetical protein
MTASNTNNPGSDDRSLRATGEPVVVGELPGMATVSELAALLEISPSTAERWVLERKLIAWERRGEVKWAVDQVLAPGTPLPGLDQIAAVMDMPPELIWDFIANPWPWAGGSPEPPMDKLRRGDLEDVLNAAPAYLDSCS